MVSNNNEMKQHLIVGEKYLQVYSAGGDLMGEVVLSDCSWGLLLFFFFFEFNMGVRASLRAPRLIPRALKLTTI
jgi:hypothetical protein